MNIQAERKNERTPRARRALVLFARVLLAFVMARRHVDGRELGSDMTGRFGANRGLEVVVVVGNAAGRWTVVRVAGASIVFLRRQLGTRRAERRGRRQGAKVERSV